MFVARTELVTPQAIADVKRALLAGDADALDAYGRFLDPIARRISAAASPAERAAIEAQLERTYSAPVVIDRCISS